MMKFNRVLSTYVLRTFVFISVALQLINCDGNSMDEIEQISLKGEILPVSTSKDVKLILSDSGNVKVIMIAPLIERFIEENESPYDLLPQGMEIEFLDSLGNVEANVKCEHSIYYPEKQILILTKNVEVYNIEGNKLNSEYLVWDANTKKITSNDFVKITTGGEIIYGNGFEADQDFTNYQIENIKGVITLEDEDI